MDRTRFTKDGRVISYKTNLRAQLKFKVLTEDPCPFGLPVTLTVAPVPPTSV